MKAENTPRFWHYTVQSHLESILTSGMIRTTGLLIDDGERAAAWASCDTEFEKTARKMILRPDGSAAVIPFGEMLDFGIIPVRIEVSLSSVPVTWEEFKRTSGIKRKTAKRLEATAIEQGSNPHLWRCSFSGIPSAAWLGIQQWDGKSWGKVAA